MSDREDIGRAAQEFARRVARDASRFGERLAEHAGDFGRTVSREWRSHGGAQSWNPDDLRGVLREVRGLLSDVVDGVDELVVRLFGGPPIEREQAAGGWRRGAAPREAACAQCGRPIAAGEERHERRTPDGYAARCLACPPEGMDPGAGRTS